MFLHISRKIRIVKSGSPRKLLELCAGTNCLEARGDRNHHPLKFGDVTTANHKVLNEESELRLQHRHTVEETFEVQEDRIKKYKSDGDRHFTAGRRVAESTVDMVLQARAKMAKERVSSWTRRRHHEGDEKNSFHRFCISEITRCFQDRSTALEEAPSTWKIEK